MTNPPYFSVNISFNEWLKIRDPLLHEQVNESWKANAAAALMGLGSSMGLVNAQSPTPTVNQVNQQEDKPEYNLEAMKKLINTYPENIDQISSRYTNFKESGEFYKKLLDPKYQKENNITEKEVSEKLHDLYKKIPAANLFFVKATDYTGKPTGYVIVENGLDFDDVTEKKLSWYYRLTPQQIQTYKKLQKQQFETYHSPENKYKDDIVAIKEVIPIDYIRMAQKNKEKFDKDYANLKNPTNDDIGFATNKEKFNKPLRMIIITDEGMNKKLGDTLGFATTDHKGSVIVMRKSSFIELPSKTSIGKLTPEGLETLAHELRHTTQDSSKTPESRKQRRDLGYKHYMHDPREMGVRIAAIKNLTTINPTILDYLGNDPVSQAIKMSLPQDEKQILNLILNNDLWEKQIIQNNPKLEQIEIEQKINYIIERIKSLDSDASSLINLYRSLNPEEKQNYMKEILQNYDKVVQNKPNYPRELNLSYPQRT
jgi:hypothetical protein